MREIDPSKTRRAEAFSLWMQARMPMVTLFQTLDVTALVKYSKKQGYQFNMLLCWCIGKAASRTEEFYMLPVGEKLMAFDRLAVNTVVALKDGGISTCDIPYTEDLAQFHKDYLRLTAQVRDTGIPHDLGAAYMVIGTSALVQYEIDGAVNIYAGFYNNPFVIWGKYRKDFRKYLLPVSFQFHHVQMDGMEAARFLADIQEEIKHLKRR